MNLLGDGRMKKVIVLAMAAALAGLGGAAQAGDAAAGSREQ